MPAFAQDAPDPGASPTAGGGPAPAGGGSRLGGLEPIEYEQAFLFGGLLLRQDAVSGRLAATVADSDLSDVPAAFGMLNTDDRDRTQGELGVRLGWQARPGRDWFVQGAWDRREYTAPVDDYGFARDSDGLSLALGLRHARPRLATEVFTGAMSQDYEDSRLGEVTARADPAPTVELSARVVGPGARRAVESASHQRTPLERHPR